MALSNEFIQAVKNNKKISVKIMLKDILIIDPTFKKFDEMIIYAKNNINNLVEDHNGEILKYDEKNWNKDYMNKQLVLLVNNFSEERLELLKKIIQKLYSDRLIKQKVKENNVKESNKNFKIIILWIIVLLILIIMLLK